MKPNYKNWVQKSLIVSMAIITTLSLIGLIIFSIYGLWITKAWRIVLIVILSIAFFGCGLTLMWSIVAYYSFSYEGKRQLSRHIIEGIKDYVNLPKDGIGLDIGCSSGALTIVCAKHNPQGKMVGIDRFGIDYAEFSLSLCQKNAKAEGGN